ncbi:MAG: FTR1 family iron permease [Candidatus Limnocylindrales bacterium]
MARLPELEGSCVIDPGAFTSGLLTGLREGVEAALIVSIVLAYLARTGNRRHFGRIWLGTGAAVAVSLGLGVLVFVTVGEFGSPYEQIFEGATMLLAAAIVTWMLFWMRRQAGAIKGELLQRIDRVLGEEGAWGLAALAFMSVVREGLEAALFLVGQAAAARQTSSAGPLSVLLGAVVGLFTAAVLGVGFYHGSRRIDLASFFRWTGIALVFIAAGLLSRAVHEFVEVGAIGIGTRVVYDLGAVLPDASGPGEFLRAIAGYSAAPEAATLAIYVLYLVVVLTLYLRPGRPAPPRPASASAT